VIDNIGADTPEEESVKPPPAVRSDHGQVGAEFLGQGSDLGSRMTSALVEGYLETGGGSPLFCPGEDIICLPFKRIKNRLLSDIWRFESVEDHRRVHAGLDDMYGMYRGVQSTSDGQRLIERLVADL
jgi:hypothetical protein